MQKRRDSAWSQAMVELGTRIAPHSFHLNVSVFFQRQAAQNADGLYILPPGPRAPRITVANTAKKEPSYIDSIEWYNCVL